MLMYYKETHKILVQRKGEQKYIIILLHYVNTLARK